MKSEDNIYPVWQHESLRPFLKDLSFLAQTLESAKEDPHTSGFLCANLFRLHQAVMQAFWSKLYAESELTEHHKLELDVSREEPVVLIHESPPEKNKMSFDPSRLRDLGGLKDIPGLDLGDLPLS